MCGITVSINFSVLDFAREKFNKSLALISHRGPDTQNIIDYGIVTLAHARLSIIDLFARSNQPMTSNCGKYAIVFNGEIYNYKKLRYELSDWDFKTESDTEVILASFKKWDINCFEKFIGPFAIVIYDRESQKIIIARDRMGEKPLFCFQNKAGIYFSSEIKGLVPFFDSEPKINKSAFDDYLHYQYVPEPDTIVDGVTKVVAGSVIEYELRSFSRTDNEFWSWSNPNLQQKNISIHDVENCLKTAVQSSLVSDVPLSIGLSAGLDSATIAYFAKEAGVDLTSFTVGYKNRPSYDERSGASDIANYFGIKNYSVEINLDDFSDNFLTFVSSLSEPIADAAGYGHYLVPKVISEHGFKVMFTGIGGDELFWGYEWTRLAVLYKENLGNFRINGRLSQYITEQKKLLKFIFILSRTRKIPQIIRPYIRLLYTLLTNKTPQDQGMFMGISGAPEFTTLLSVGKDYYGPAMIDINNNVYKHSMDISQDEQDIALNVLLKLNRTWLISNSVQLSDSLSMSMGVESRAPFLNPDLVTCMLQYNTTNRSDLEGGKSILKKIMHNKLPDNFLNRPKSGFVTPIGSWVKALELKFGAQIDGGNLVKNGLIKKNFFQICKSENITLHTKYRMILLELWYENLLKNYYE